LLRIKTELSAPLLCFVGEQALSAAFYVALCADELMVTRSALLGSVGAIQQYYSVKELARRIGIDVRTFSRGKHKGGTSPFEEISDEQTQAIQSTLDETTAHFTEWIAGRRPRATLNPEQWAALSAVLTGGRCVELGLADRVGGLFDVLDRARELGAVTTSPGLLRVSVDDRSQPSTPLNWLMKFAIERLLPSR